MTVPQRTRLADRRDRALEDLLDLERRVADGEVDPQTALTLRRRYETAAADALAALDQLEEAAPSRSPRRVILGVVGFAVVAAVAAIGLLAAVEPRPEGGFVTGGVAADAVADTGGTDLSAVTNEELEAVIAQNPEVLPMRLALARRYVEDGDFSSALTHYLYVLEREENAEALMYVGWMTYVSGDAATGVALLERSLLVAPGQPLAQWFLANALLDGLGDAERAIPLLEAVITSGSTPAEVVTAAQQMLDEARQ